MRDMTNFVGSRQRITVLKYASTIFPFPRLLTLFSLGNLCGVQKSLLGLLVSWTTALCEILTLDNLWNMGVTILDWCYMCERSEESANHLLLHCPIALELWSMVWALFGLLWVVP